MSATAIILKQNRFMRNFRAAGATGPATARGPEEIGCRQGWIFRRMVAAGVFIPAGNDKFYLDEEAATRFVRRRRNKALVLAGAVMLVFIFVWLTVHR